MRYLWPALLAFLAFSVPTLAQPDVPAAFPTVRIMVVPFESRTAARSLGAYTFGFSTTIAERFEDEPGFAVVNGLLVMTAEQARLVSPLGTGLDLAAANQLAASRGATHFLTGEFGGQIENLTIVGRLYEVTPGGPVMVGEGVANGDINELTAGGRPVQSARRIHALLAVAVDGAFDTAGLPLAPATSVALAEPPTGDAWAYLLYGRAYSRLYNGQAVDPGQRSALAFAENAVLVDPTFAEAQRLYAHLLAEAGRTRSARIHYEQALARRPNDTRSLVALGRIELDQGNPDLARGYLSRAVAARSGDADAHYWLGLANLRLGDVAEAILRFEGSRRLDPGHADARRQLIRLYSAARRYREAAAEARAIVDREPSDLDAVFALAACLRADGRSDEAVAVYEGAAGRFPGESRLPKFRGDLLSDAGRVDDAAAAYREALRLSPRDRRLIAALGRTDAQDGGGTPSIGGAVLRRTIRDASVRATLMEGTRGRFQEAVNDAAADFSLNRERGCMDGNAVSSAMLAQAEGRTYAELGRTQSVDAAAVRSAMGSGEDAALTPDEAASAAAIVSAMEASERDVREMWASYRLSVLPPARRYRCDTFDGPLRAATIEEVRARSAARRVTLPEVNPPRYGSSISPVVPSDVSRIVRFRVDNSAGSVDYVLTLDGEELGVIARGGLATFTTRFGYHRLCLAPRGTRCGDDGTVRSVFFHDGLTWLVNGSR